MSKFEIIWESRPQSIHTTSIVKIQKRIECLIMSLIRIGKPSTRVDLAHKDRRKLIVDTIHTRLGMWQTVLRSSIKWSETEITERSDSLSEAFSQEVPMIRGLSLKSCNLPMGNTDLRVSRDTMITGIIEHQSTVTESTGQPQKTQSVDPSTDKVRNSFFILQSKSS